MNTSNLLKITKNKKRRLGQGHGSGRVKTSGRGTKGQKARGKIPLTRYSGGSLAFVKRLPFLRGKNRNKPYAKIPGIINVDKLNILPKNSVVDIETLVKYNLVSKEDAKDGVKILGGKDLNVSLTVKVPVSSSAKKIIEKLGGKIESANE